LEERSAIDDLNVFTKQAIVLVLGEPAAADVFIFYFE